MDLKQITAKFKAMTQKLEEQAPEAAPEVVELKEATLTDGTIIKYDNLEVGSAVIAVTEEGEVPAPDATHQLEDGTLITTVEGVITEVVEGAPMAEEEEEMFNAEQEFSALKIENETLKQELESFKTQFSKVNETLGEMTGMLENVEKIVEMAAQEPSQPAAEKPKQVSVKSFRSAFN